MRWAALAACALGLAACGGSGGTAAKPTPVPHKTPEVLNEIPTPPVGDVETFKGQSLTEQDTHRMARTITAALRGGHERAYLGLFDPGAKAVIAKQRTWFENVRRVPMAERTIYVVGNKQAIDSSGRRELTADVGFEHRIQGADARPVAEWYRYGFKKRSGSLKIVSVRGARPVTTSGTKYSRYYPQSWDQGAIAVATGSRSVVLGPAADAATLRSIASTSDAAVSAMVGKLGGLGLKLPAAARRDKWVITLAAPGVASVFDYFGGEVTPTEANYVGVTVPIFKTDRATGEARGDAPVTSRIALSRQEIGNGDLAATMRHEMVHALLHTFGFGSAPPWIAEGAAVLFSDAPASELAYRRNAGLQGLAANRHMPETGFYAGNDTIVSQHYGMAYLAMGYLADRYGERALMQRLRRVYSGDMSPAVFAGDPKTLISRVRKWAS